MQTAPPPASPERIYRSAMRAGLIGLVANCLLAAVKLIGGIVGQSVALVSDAVNSLADSLTSLAVVIALHYSQRPPDEEHPYGHTRAESVAASNVALVIILTALYVGYEAITRFAAPRITPPVWTLWIAGANVLIKEALYRYKVRVGKRTGSAAVVANAWDHRSDAFCSLAVFVGLAAVRWGGEPWAWADPAAALVVVAAILYTGVVLFFRSLSDLLDPQAEPQLVEQIRRAAEEVPGVRAVEKLWVRKTGIEHLADIHIEVDAQMTVEAGHRIGHEVKDQLLARFPTLRDVLVHLEPYLLGH